MMDGVSMRRLALAPRLAPCVCTGRVNGVRAMPDLLFYARIGMAGTPERRFQAKRSRTRAFPSI